MKKLLSWWNSHEWQVVDTLLVVAMVALAGTLWYATIWWNRI